MIDRAWRGDRQKHRWQKQDWKVSLSVCYYGKAEKICVGEMLKVSGIEISRRILRLALSRLSMPEEPGQKPVNPTVLCTILDYICPCLTLLLFFIFLLHSCLLCLLFAFSCITKISTLSGGWLMVLSKLSLFFLNPLPHVIFLCICVTVICPLSFCVVHFFPLYADFFVTTFDSQLWWHSTPWSASRPKRHCTAYMCACVFVCVRGRACLFFQMHDILCMCDNQRLFFLLHLSQYCWVS